MKFLLFFISLLSFTTFISHAAEEHKSLGEPRKNSLLTTKPRIVNRTHLVIEYESTHNAATIVKQDIKPHEKSTLCMAAACNSCTKKLNQSGWNW